MSISIKFRNSFSKKCELMVSARCAIENSGLSQSDIAKKVGCSQPRISSLISGEIDKFSIEWLMDFIEDIGK